MDKDILTELYMTPKEYLEQLFTENPLLISDPNYKTVLISSIRSKYYFDVSLEDTLQTLDEMLRELGKLRSQESTTYPSIVVMNPHRSALFWNQFVDLRR